MLWDGLLFLALVSLCIAGWNVGIINSWRAPIAMIIATIATQQFYIDFATWIEQQTMLEPKWSAFAAYVMMWLVVEIVTEICMSLFLPWNRKDRPMALDRVGGLGLAFVRWVVICSLPLMAMYAPNKLPALPKKEKTGDEFIYPFTNSFEQSNIMNGMGGFAKGLIPSLGQIVVSDKAPSFKPNFDRPKAQLD
jgi:uncharacterized membrane protein required for colicin V production